MEDSWETGSTQYLEMDDAQEFQDCHTMMNLGEEEEEFLRNIGQRPDGQYSSTDLDPVWSEIMPSCHQRDETENNGTTNSSDNVVSPRAYVLSLDSSAVNPVITKQEEEYITSKRSSPIKRSRAAGESVEGRKNKKRCSEEVEDHTMAEGRRRQRITEKLIALSSTIPGLKKRETEFKILSLLENFHLSVTSSSVLPFGKSTLGITIIAQVGDEYNTPVSEVVKNLRQILLSPS